MLALRFYRSAALVVLFTALVWAGSAGRSFGQSSTANLHYQSYVDPAEHAFVDSVPSGWRIGGRLVRYGPITIAPFVQAMSQDGTIFVQLGDWHIKDYSDQAGRREGSLYWPGTSVMIVRRFKGAADYAGSYSGAFGQALGCEQPQVTSSERVANPPGVQTIPQSNLESSVVHFTCQRSGQHYVGQVMVTLQSYRLPNSTGWNVVYLASFLAREDGADTGLAVWNEMRTSIKILPEWNAKESRIAAAATRPAQDALDATLRQAQEFDQRVITGQITVNDPTVGSRSETNMGAAPFYFSDGQGHFYCSYNPTPRPGFHSVETVR
jgi:hypothetical protein